MAQLVGKSFHKPNQTKQKKKQKTHSLGFRSGTSRRQRIQVSLSLPPQNPDKHVPGEE